MGEVTIKVPAEHVESFRLAAIAEIRQTANWAQDAADEFSRSCATSDDPVNEDPGDIHESVKCVRQDVAILDQLLGVEPGELEVHGDANALAHIAETMARKVVPPQIADATGIGPFDAKVAKSVDTLTAALGWASGESVRLHEIDSIERRTARA